MITSWVQKCTSFTVTRHLHAFIRWSYGFGCWHESICVSSISNIYNSMSPQHTVTEHGQASHPADTSQHDSTSSEASASDFYIHQAIQQVQNHAQITAHQQSVFDAFHTSTVFDIWLHSQSRQHHQSVGSSNQLPQIRFNNFTNPQSVSFTLQGKVSSHALSNISIIRDLLRETQWWLFWRVQVSYV